MKPPLRQRSALGSWAASLPLALAIPAVIWTIFAIVEAASLRGLDALPVIAIAMAVHLLSYLITGLPIFLCKFKSPGSRIWKLPVALLTGGLLGAGFAFFVLIAVENLTLSAIPAACLGCGGYGLATAFAAWLQRPLPQNP